ncbi:MAG: YggS family pyridoxal phosphate-dependent enzyme [Clostridiales bacterium]|nr:YggS family pyridoxal phosphate-dependent enzyme [Clostridiales bacterium]
MTERSYTDNGLRIVEDNFKRVKDEIAEAAVKAGRAPEDVKLMAVTKTVEPIFINKVIQCGAELIGENKVQEVLNKKDELDLSSCKLHLIGHLQTNKVKQIVGEVSAIQSVDSVKIASEIGKYSLKKGITTDILLEVNIGKEESKFGFLPEEVEERACEIAEIEGVKVRGLMTVPPFIDDKEKIHGFFSNMRQLFIDIGAKKIHNIDMTVLSMGMSADFALAVAEGSTLVRVGTAIFGMRHYD